MPVIAAKSSSSPTTHANRVEFESAPKAPDAFGQLLRTLAVIVFFAGCAYLSCAWGRPRFAYAEAPFCLIPREMMDAGTLISPLFHGMPYYDKPILSYWLILASYKLFGISLFTSRIPSVIYALTTLCLVAMSAGAMFGVRCAVICATVLATSYSFASFASVSMPDMLLTMIDSCTLVCLYASTRLSSQRPLLLSLAGISTGLAFLTKGPIGLVLPALLYLAFLTITRQRKVLKLSHVFLAGICFCVVALPWHIAALIADGPDSLRWLYITGNLQRFVGVVGAYNFSHGPEYMLKATLAGLLPWSILAPFMCFSSLQSWRTKFDSEPARLELYLWMWCVLSVAFFSLSKSNWGYYSLPLYPAFAMLAGIYLHTIVAKRPNLARVPSLLIGVLCVASVAFSCYAIKIMPGTAAKDATTVFSDILKKQPHSVRFVFDQELSGQYNLFELIRLQTGRDMACIGNDELISTLNANQPIMLLLTQDRYGMLPPAIRSRLRVVESRPYNFINYPGAVLRRAGKEQQVVPILLATNSNG